MDLDPTIQIEAHGDATFSAAADLPAPLNELHAALRADMELLAANIINQLYARVSADISQSNADTNTTIA
jgi:hypothetical protein